MTKGFTFYWRGQDNFFESSRTRVTKEVATEIISILMPNAEITSEAINYVKYAVKRATYELKNSKWGKYCDIVGDGFSYGGNISDYKYQHYYKLSK